MKHFYSLSYNSSAQRTATAEWQNILSSTVFKHFSRTAAGSGFFSQHLVEFSSIQEQFAMKSQQGKIMKRVNCSLCYWLIATSMCTLHVHSHFIYLKNTYLYRTGHLKPQKYSTKQYLQTVCLHSYRPPLGSVHSYTPHYTLDFLCGGTQSEAEMVDLDLFISRH